MRRALPLLLLALAACGGFEPLPADFGDEKRPLTQERVALGRMLFHDARLSRNHDVACVSCHALDAFGVDGQRVSAGHAGATTRRNSPSVYNAAGAFAQFWDGRSEDVEAQALGPLLSPVEMAMDEARVLETLGSMPEYVEHFRAAFPGEAKPLRLENVGRAIGAFERTLVTPSRFDRFLSGDEGALSAEEQRGFERFQDLGCDRCHDGVLIGATRFEKLGEEREYPDQSDLGRFEVTGDKDDKMKFRIASLRNVARTAPYFHNGTVETLEEAVRLMGRHQLGEELSEGDIASVVAWLGSLTGELPPTEAIAKPALPPSTPGTPVPSIEG